MVVRCCVIDRTSGDLVCLVLESAQPQTHAKSNLCSYLVVIAKRIQSLGGHLLGKPEAPPSMMKSSILFTCKKIGVTKHPFLEYGFGRSCQVFGDRHSTLCRVQSASDITAANKQVFQTSQKV